MPANNARAMSKDELHALNDKYKISYQSDKELILVELSTCARKTFHWAGKSFSLNSKQNPKRKIVFSETVVKMWQKFQLDDRHKMHTIFDVQNAVVMLKLMYQPVTEQKVIELLRKGFDGIKKL